MNEPRLRISLIGCGQIADAHLQEIRKIASAELLAVCDRHRPLAEQAAARFGAPNVCTELSDLLEKHRPDVLHITTPPQTHKPIALAAIQHGVHVYIEKPFSIDAAEAREILAAAKSAGVQVCVGHDQIFDPIWLALKHDQQCGRLGRIVHVESIQGYDLHGQFGKLVMDQRDHWVHRLPGGLLQNTMSHALYKLTDFLTDSEPQVHAEWRDPEGVGFPTDLRASLWGGEVSGNLIFTSQARPAQRVVRVFGTEQIAEIDFDGQTIRRARPPRWPGAFARLESPARHWLEAGRAFWRNAWRFARSDLHYFAGMRELFRRFYASIGGDPAPISPDEIVRVTALMDTIFARCRRGAGEAAPSFVEAAS
jgi:predicted dehydrogenase